MGPNLNQRKSPMGESSVTDVADQDIIRPSVGSVRAWRAVGAVGPDRWNLVLPWTNASGSTIQTPFLTTQTV